jgi:predicted peptidase
MKQTFIILLFLFGCMLHPACIVVSLAQPTEAYKEGRLIREGDTLEYRYLLPLDFSKNKKYPMVLFLHGAGERGEDNKKQLVHGSRLFLDSIKKYPAIVIFPQCSSDSYWSSVITFSNEKGDRKFIFPAEVKPTKAMQLVLHLVDSVMREDYVDKNRVYLAGLSMGGMGTFELLGRRPEVFAAAVPICGGGNPEMVRNYNPGTAFWVFHGGKDEVVPPLHSTVMVKALQEHDFPVRYTLYHEANHNSWDRAFSEPDLLSWLFSQKLNKN